MKLATAVKSTLAALSILAVGFAVGIGLVKMKPSAKVSEPVPDTVAVIESNGYVVRLIVPFKAPGGVAGSVDRFLHAHAGKLSCTGIDTRWSGFDGETTVLLLCPKVMPPEPNGAIEAQELTKE